MAFIIKSLGASKGIDEDGKIELNRSEQIELFQIIDELCQEIGCKKPSKVYLSSNVNAALEMEPSLLNIILPPRKNLVLGLGLINTCTVDELRAVLSHEFGHFTQNTTKIGTYVYRMNMVFHKIIFNKENKHNYQVDTDHWLIGLASSVVESMIDLIGDIMQQAYLFLNRYNAGLSREMEFHADEVAAHFTGKHQLANALLRMQLTSFCFEEIFRYYNSKQNMSLYSENIYNEHLYIVDLHAKKSKLSYKNGLPVVTLNDYSQYHSSDLYLEDQWASHPDLETRIKKLNQLQVPTLKVENPELANSLIANLEDLQTSITHQIFKPIKEKEEAIALSLQRFKFAYKMEFERYAFNEVYDQYYDHKAPKNVLKNVSREINVPDKIEELFSKQKVALVYRELYLESDLEILENIANGTLTVKTFDYKGVKYKSRKARSIIEDIKTELESTRAEVETNDLKIFKYFLKLESQSNNPPKLKTLYTRLFDNQPIWEDLIKTAQTVLEKLEFVSRQTTYDEINIKFNEIKTYEDQIKAVIPVQLSQNDLSLYLESDVIKTLKNYAEEEHLYFENGRYNDPNLNLLFSSLLHFIDLIQIASYRDKKTLLAYQAQLYSQSDTVPTEIEKVNVS